MEAGTMVRKFVCVRARNQITLPIEVISHLQIAEGDYLQVEIAASGKAQLVPARLAVVGTSEAKEQDKQAEEQIRTGQFETFHDVNSFARSLGESQTEDTVPSPRSIIKMERDLMVATLHATKWNKSAAAKRLGWNTSRFNEKLKKFKLTPEPTK
jgi:transcriptional regulator of acetoin/glycerol metabolism